MPPKSPVADSPAKARPITQLSFSQPVKLPGISGATATVTTRPPTSPFATGATKVDSIFLYEDCFCINGGFWIPKTAGALLGWEY